MQTKYAQKGLSLIELMVALTISSFLIIGVTQIYVDNKRNYVFQQSQSETLEGNRFAQLFLQQELSKAGYRRRPDEPWENAFKADSTSTPGCNFAEGETVKYISASSICIRYQPRDDKDRDCLGNAVTTATDFNSPYTKATQNFNELIALNSATGELTCKVGSTAAVALANGVADLRFELGVGNATSPRGVVRYITATPAASEPILSVRITSLIRSSGQNVRDSSTIDTALQTWKDLTGASATAVTSIKNADKGQLYQVAQSTVMLRNKMP